MDSLNLKIDRWIPFRDRYLVWGIGRVLEGGYEIRSEEERKIGRREEGKEG